MKKSTPTNENDDMYKAILALQNIEECKDFFRDLCAKTEIQSMEQRYLVAGMLKKDRVYSDIADKTGASTATISRVNRMLSDGTGVLLRTLEDNA